MVEIALPFVEIEMSKKLGKILHLLFALYFSNFGKLYFSLITIGVCHLHIRQPKI